MLPQVFLSLSKIDQTGVMNFFLVEKVGSRLFNIPQKEGFQSENQGNFDTKKALILD